ncbi:MAG: MATE family efflux transporter [Sulfurimonas sp.]|nr:MAG: MATE family efflux transporter [Sulfurimonas sp.]
MHLDLNSGEIKSNIFKLAVPAVIGYFFHTMFNVTDTYFAGLISTNALAALALSASAFFMLLAIAVGMSEAVTSLVGNALGEKDLDKARHITLNSISFAFLLSLFVSTLGILSIPYLIEALDNPSYKAQTLEYMNMILYGAIFFVGSFFINALLTAIGDTKSFRNILIFTAFLNIFLNYIFVIYMDLQVSGIALATVISEAITLLYLIYKLKSTTLWCGYSNYVFDGALIKQLLKQGIPPSVNMFMMAFGMYIITYFVAPYGSQSVAAFGIGMRIEQIFLMPVIGLNIAVLAIISQNNGAKQFQKIMPTVSLSIKYGWILSTLGVSSFLLFGEFFASLLTQDPEVIKEAALYLRVSGLASYAFVVIFIYIAMLQGIAKPSVIVPVSIYRQVIAPIILFSILKLMHLEIISLWIGLNFIIFSSAIFLYWYGNQQLSTKS